MKKIKKPTGHELFGSAGIAFALYMGAMALNQDTQAGQASTAAAQYGQEAAVAGESGMVKQAHAASESAGDARRNERQGRYGTDYLGFLSALALVGGIDAYARQIKADAKSRVAGPDQTAPVPMELEPFTEHDVTQRIEGLSVPVPRPIPAQHPPVLQKR